MKNISKKIFMWLINTLSVPIRKIFPTIIAVTHILSLIKKQSKINKSSIASIQLNLKYFNN